MRARARKRCYVVSSRHTTRWKTSWWIRIDDAESGEQPGERLKKPAMETGVGEAQRQAEEAKGERETDQTGQ